MAGGWGHLSSVGWGPEQGVGAFWEGPWPNEAQQDPPKLVVPPPLSPVLKVLRERLYLISSPAA